MSSLHTYSNEGSDQSIPTEKRAPMRFGKRDEAFLHLKRAGAGLQEDLNEFKILRTVRAPMRFGKRSDRFKKVLPEYKFRSFYKYYKFYLGKAPMRFGKRAPMRFGKRDLESPSYLNEENYDYRAPAYNSGDLFGLTNDY